MMATVPHVTSGLGLRKFQADGFLLTRVYNFFSALDLQNLTLYDQRKFQNSSCGNFKQRD